MTADMHPWRETHTYEQDPAPAAGSLPFKTTLRIKRNEGRDRWCSVVRSSDGQAVFYCVGYRRSLLLVVIRGLRDWHYERRRWDTFHRTYKREH